MEVEKAQWVENGLCAYCSLSKHNISECKKLEQAQARATAMVSNMELVQKAEPLMEARPKN